MKISHQLLQKVAARSGGTNASAMLLLRPLGTLAGRTTLPSLNQQPQLMRRHFHGASTPNNDGTKHHIIPSADEHYVLTNDPSTIKRNFRTRLEQTKQSARIGGGVTRIDKQHAKGSLTARERISLLFDGGSFREVDALVTHRCSEFDMDKIVIPGDGVVVGEYNLSRYCMYLFVKSAYFNRFLLSLSFVQFNIQQKQKQDTD